MGGSIGRIQTRGETVFFSCQEALDPDLYAEVKFNTSLFHTFLKLLGTADTRSWQRYALIADISMSMMKRDWFEEHIKSSNCYLASELPRFQSDLISVECAGERKQHTTCRTWICATNVLAPSVRNVL